MRDGMRPILPDMPGMDDDAPAEKPKVLTEEQRRTEAKKKKEADDFVAHARKTIPGNWRPLPNKDNPYPDQNEEDRVAEDRAGLMGVGGIRIGNFDTSKLKTGIVYRNDDTGVDIRLKKDMSISFPRPIKYYEGSSEMIKSGTIQTDNDFLKTFGGGINFYKKHVGPKAIYFDVNEVLLSPERIKKLINHAGQEPAVDLEFGTQINEYIDSLPHKVKDEIDKMQIELRNKAKLTGLMKGRQNDEAELEAHNDKIVNVNADQPLVANAQHLEVQMGPVAPGGGAGQIMIDDTIDKVSDELGKVDTHVLETKNALNDMKSSLNAYNEILNSRPEDLIKSPTPQLEAKLAAEAATSGAAPRRNFPTLFHQIQAACQDSETARGKLLTTVNTEITALDNSKKACEQALTNLKALPEISTVPAVPPKTAADVAEHKKRNDDITKLQDKITKIDTEITSLETLRDETQQLDTKVKNDMKAKAKAVNDVIAPKPAGRHVPGG